MKLLCLVTIATQLTLYISSVIKYSLVIIPGVFNIALNGVD
jgi:hypothetical protein